MYHPNKSNFSPTELFPPEVIARFPGYGGMFLLNPLLCITLQQLRNRFGRMRLNSPRLGLTQRVIRTVEHYMKKERAKGGKDYKRRAWNAYKRYWGMHKVAGAVDCDFLDYELEEVIDYIRNHPDEFPFISFIEVDINWFHFDVRNQEGITFWSPKDGVLEVVPQLPIDWSKLVDIEGSTFKGKK